MVVCHCEAINDARIRNLLEGPVLDVDGALADISDVCGAGSRCGGCVDSIRALVAAHIGGGDGTAVSVIRR